MATRDVEFRLKFSSEGLVRVIDQTGREVEDLQREFDELNARQRKSFEGVSKSVRKNNKELVEQGKQLKRNKVEFGSFGDEVTGKFEEAADSGGTLTSLLGRMATRGGAAGAIVAGGIAVIVGSFLEAEGAALKFQDTLAGLTRGGRRLLSGLAASVRAFVAVSNGNFKQAAIEANLARNAYLGIGEAIKEGAEGNRILRETRLATIELTKSQADQLAQMEKLRMRSQEEQRSTANRIRLIREAASIEAGINEKRIELLNREIRGIELTTERLSDQPPKLEEIAGIEAEIAELRAANSVLAVSTESEINALLREQEELRAAILESLREFESVYTGQEAELGIQKQIESLEQLRDSIVDAGIADAASEQVQQIQNSIDGLTRRLTEGLPEGFSELPTLTKQIGDEAIQSLVGRDWYKEGVEAGKQIIVGVSDGAEQTGSVLEELTQEQASFVRAQFEDSLASIGDIITSIYDQQIAAIDRVISKQEERVSTLESQLQEEIELQEEGKTNNVKLLREQLEAEQKVLQDAQEKKLKLEREQAKIQLAINTALEVSNTAVAVSKLVAAEASKGIIGLVLAAAGIATILRLVARAKANAAARAQADIPQFAQGTPYLDGKPHSAGGTVIEAEKGERILSVKHNEAVGGRALSNEELVQYATVGRNVMEGTMLGALEDARAARASSTRAQLVQSTKSAGGETYLRKMLELMEKKPTVYPSGPHVREWRDSFGNVRREKVQV